MDEQRSDEQATGFPEPPGRDPEDHARDRDPHHAPNHPARDPDATEWPGPYERGE